MSETVLVTGGFGLVGWETVKRFAADGRPVVATDLDVPANHKKARALPTGAEVRWADLTNTAEVDRLLSEVAPATIVHLAALIAPPIYRNAALGRKVNVDATATRSWNADVYTSWSFRRSLALYGRLGYVQAEAVPGFAIVASPPGDPRRMRDGMNYGVGLRYDVTPALGLRLEYARFGRFAGETIGGLMPESNQMQFGMQFRF